MGLMNGYRQSGAAVIVDLICASGDLRQTIEARGPVLSEFPGLFIADFARNRGHRTRQVIVYSVHIVEAVAEECRKLYCTYVPKADLGSLSKKSLMFFHMTPRRGDVL